MSTIALTGQHPSPIEKIAEITLKAPSFETPRIQEIHIAVIHSLCRGIETVLFPEQSKKILPASKLVEASCVDAFFSLVKPYKSVFTNGCFDIIHPGHISLLNSCRSMGDLLIVGLNADESVKKLKGRKRPFYKLFDRATILSALSAVDYIIPFDADTPIDLIRRLSPSILVKGGDYQKETVVGADWVESHGGEVRIVPILKGYSTTFILEGKINE
ncbi:adenylyltransferase/cytidyltransferase family protein [bacterium]|nr:adenylyltransferase/cytidyltransferase family protein [bacterium]